MKLHKGPVPQGWERVPGLPLYIRPVELPPPKDGEVGPPGPQGEPGPPGPQGEAGPPGEPGRDGRDGLDGKDGRDGALGPRGERGPAGPAGRDGVDGKDGADGVGIGDITSHGRDMLITLTDGSEKRFKLAGGGGTPFGGSNPSTGGGGGGSGTVTSVDVAVPLGLQASGGPVTSSGTITLSYAAGYSLPTDASQANWNTAYGWGNHASAGYLLASTAASTYQPIGTYLTPSSIGVTVQGYSANLTSWAALATSAKQDALVSGTNLKTVNGTSLLGAGDLVTPSGTVTSVAVSGGTTGLTTSGGPVTGSGTITLAGTLALANGGTGQTSAPAAMTALMGFTSTATAGATTTLTNASSYYQVFTGTSNQTVQLPATSTLAQGWSFHIVNNSTGTLTVQTSTAVSLGTIPGGVTAMPTALTTTGNTATDWEFGYTDFSTLTGTGNVVLATNPTITNPVLASTTYMQQGAQTSLSAAATLTIAQLLTGIIQYTGAAANLTLPTGTSIEGGVVSGLAVDRAFEFVVINTGTGAATIVTNTGLTTVGALAVTNGTSARFRVRKTATNTYTVYRVG